MKACVWSAAALILAAGPASAASAGFPLVDAHIHLDEKAPVASVAMLVEAMDRLHEPHVVVQTAPYGAGDPDAWDLETIAAAVKAHPGRLAFNGGGGTLNPMLAEAYAKGDVGPEARRRLRARAEAILRAGAAGFGELSNEHFVMGAGGVADYESYPADFALMLLLADIAAAHGVPIDLHMEAVPADMASGLPPPNAATLHANLKGLENLLAHNRRARIIWAHAGSDNTGFRTPERMRPMLKRNPNLYMEIKVDPGAPGKTYPLDADGKLKPEWRALFADFADRFIVGSDQHYDANAVKTLARVRNEQALLAQLPTPVRRKIAVENPERLYKFGR